MLAKFTTALIASASIAHAASTSQTYAIDPDLKSFVDEQGRSRIFHGFNVVVKKPDYIPVEDHFDFDMSVSTEDLEYMRDWGTKIVRLGVMWESVERSPGVYDYDYLD